MTPEAVQMVSNLRREFYTLFAAEMKVPVKISGSSYNRSSSIASWVDEQEHLNYVSIYAYTAPDSLLAERPFILRVAINKGAGGITFFKRDQPHQGMNQGWHFELTVLPDELLAFLPWIVSLVKAKTKAKGSHSSLQEPPYPVSLNTANVLLSTEAWSQEAERMSELPCQALPQL
ncbi:MAG: hypothetical protein KME27_22810 [Lyngbya sp. HA4199-MV5]|nr:hypothetical protein [Lyngbya sp. HA4199-MV5]